MVEQWKTVLGLEKYEISSYGRVRNSTNGRILRGSINSRGYRRYDLSIDGERIVRCGHVLVANAFIPKCDGKHLVNHKDGDRLNNHVSNLEWCTHSENIIHGIYVLGHSTTQNKRRRVRCVETGVVYDSILAAAHINNIPDSNIVNCCKGVRKTAKGFHWEYADVAQ